MALQPEYESEQMGHLNEEQNILMRGDFFTPVIVTEDQSNPFLYAMERRARDGEADKENGIDRGVEVLYLHDLQLGKTPEYQHVISLFHPEIPGINLPLGRTLNFTYEPGMQIEKTDSSDGGPIATAIQGQLIGVAGTGLVLRKVTYKNSTGRHELDPEAILSIPVPVRVTISLVSSHESARSLLYSGAPPDPVQARRMMNR